METLSIYSFLSEDFVFNEILTKVPVKSLMRFKCVSKSWLSRITTDSNFIDHHLKTAKPSTIIRAVRRHDVDNIMRFFHLGHTDSNPVEISISYLKRALTENRPGYIFHVYLIGSCNGLVCLDFLFRGRQKQLVLWNPATRKFRCLPEPLPPVLTRGTYHFTAEQHCFGFDEVSNDYKIVRVYAFARYDGVIREAVLEVQLFTKSTGRWKRLRGFSGLKLTGIIEEGLALEGVMNWLVVRGPIPAKGSFFRLLTFDIRSEELKVIDGPASGSDDVDYRNLQIIKWKGCLGAIMTTVENKLEFWLRGKHGSGWTKVLTFGVPWEIAFQGVLKDRLIFFDQRDRHEEEIVFVEEFRDIIAYKFQDYVPTLISPN